MQDAKVQFLQLLENEYKQYCDIPTSESQPKKEKKQFINGLMTAARVFDVSFEELNSIIEAHPSQKYTTLDEMLEIPTYLR